MHLLILSECKQIKSNQKITELKKINAPVNVGECEQIKPNKKLQN